MSNFLDHKVFLIRIQSPSLNYPTSLSLKGSQLSTNFRIFQSVDSFKVRGHLVTCSKVHKTASVQLYPDRFQFIKVPAKANSKLSHPSSVTKE